MIIKPYIKKNTRNKNLKKGQSNEEDSAYYIDFDHENDPLSMVLHDLRLEYNGRTAQIDHLLIRPAAIYVIESKFSTGAFKYENNCWTAIYDTYEMSIPSPIEQNQRHIQVLEDILINEDILKKPFFGKRNPPIIFNIIFISNKTIIQGNLPDTVMKNDSFSSYRKKNRFKNINVTKGIINENDMENVAKKILSFHTPVEKKENINTKKKKRSEESFKKPEGALIDRLKAVRLRFAREHDIKAYMVFSNKVLDELVKVKPKDKKEMLIISGIGEVKFEKYGLAFLNEINNSEEIAVTAAKIVSKSDIDLFLILKNMRNAFAEYEGISPYNIFLDKELQAIIEFKPKNEKELLSVDCVNKDNLQTYSKSILNAING